MAPITTAKGYAIKDVKDYKNFELVEFKLKTQEPEDLVVHVECCGVCGSDHHTISGGWGPLANKFCVTGHEVVGTVVQMGEAVKDFKIGQRVGVGAQKGSCGKCKLCLSDNEQYCDVFIVHGYNGFWEDGTDNQGGYATYVTARQQFVHHLPDGVASTDAASMLCAGLTVFSPLKRNHIGPGSKVGIVGLGGLGMYGVLFAAGLGAEVTVFSHSESKKDDALKLGAKHFVITSKGFEEPLKGSLDFIISASSSSSLPLNELLSTLVIHGKLCFVGMPDGDLPPLSSQSLSGNGAYIGSSHIGSKVEAAEMFKLVVEKNIKPMVQVMPMKDAAKAIEAVEKGTVRYRTVLIQDIDA